MSWIISVVDVDQGGLEDVQGEHPELLLVAAVGRELAAFAVEDHAVDAVPRLDQVQALFDLALQVAIAEVAARGAPGVDGITIDDVMRSGELAVWLIVASAGGGVRARREKGVRGRGLVGRP
jgi:hypothetical protein